MAVSPWVMDEMAIRAIIPDIAAEDTLLRKTSETGGRVYEAVGLGSRVGWDGDNLNVIDAPTFDWYNGSQFFAPSGTQGAPGYSFSAEHATGLYYATDSGAQAVRVSVGNSLIAMFSGSLPSLKMYAEIQAQDGAVNYPGLGFMGEYTTGFYRSAGSEISVTLAGTRYAKFGVGGVYADALRSLAGNALSIGNTTADGSDDSVISFFAGGAAGDTRGATILGYGNEHINTGVLEMRAGNVTGSYLVAGVGTAAYMILDHDTNSFSFECGGAQKLSLNTTAAVFAVTLQALRLGIGTPAHATDELTVNGTSTFNDTIISTSTIQGTRYGAGAAADADAIYYGTSAHATAPTMWLNQSSTGDAYTRYSIATTRSYAWGVDNSDSDKMVLSTEASGTAVPGTTNLLSITTAGVMVVTSTIQGTGLSAGATLISGASISSGDTTSAGTATPSTWNMGGTFANGAGDPSKMKLRLYDDTALRIGLGVSSGVLEYFCSGTHNWYLDSGGTAVNTLTHDYNSGTAMTRFYVKGKSGYAAALYLNALTAAGAANGDSWRIVSNVAATGTLTVQNNISGSFVDKLSLTTAGAVTCASTLQATGLSVGRALTSGLCDIYSGADNAYIYATCVAANKTAMFNAAADGGSCRIGIGGTTAAGSLCGVNYADGAFIRAVTATGFVIGTSDACPIVLGTNNAAAITISTAQAVTCASTLKATELRASSDIGGEANCTSLTNAKQTTISTGVGSVKMLGTTARDCTGWIKIYVGTDARFIPYWTTVTG